MKIDCCTYILFYIKVRICAMETIALNVVYRNHVYYLTFQLNSVHGCALCTFNLTNVN